MIALSHEMIVGVEESALIEIANTAAGDTPEESRITRRDLKKVPHCKRSHRRKTIDNGATPCRIRAVCAKEMQEPVYE